MAFATLFCLVLQKPKRDLTPALFAHRARTQMILVVHQLFRVPSRHVLVHAFPCHAAKSRRSWQIQPTPGALGSEHACKQCDPGRYADNKSGKAFVESALWVVHFLRKGTPRNHDALEDCTLCPHFHALNPDEGPRDHATRKTARMEGSFSVPGVRSRT